MFQCSNIFKIQQILRCFVTSGEEWRSKWLLEKRWQTASTDELIRGMNDINDHVRLAAVAACNKAAELRQRKKAEQSFGKKSYYNTIKSPNQCSLTI